MTISDLLNKTSRLLAEQNNQDAHFESEILLSYVLGISRTQLYTNLKQSLKRREIMSFSKLVKRRLRQEPLAYITKHQEFYGIKFYVDQHVLIPRPETELLVEEAIRFAKNREQGEPLVIADIGTGCGCIAISLALHLPLARIYATDISTNALKVAHMNCERHKVSNRVILKYGSLLEPLPKPVHLIVANLPYLSCSEIANLSSQVKDFEPRLALDGGQDGLDVIRQLFEGIDKKLCQDSCLLLEIGKGQGITVKSLINNFYPQAKVELLPDLNSIDRVVKVIFQSINFLDTN